MCSFIDTKLTGDMTFYDINGQLKEKICTATNTVTYLRPVNKNSRFHGSYR